jgi:hypothetical protein
MISENRCQSSKACLTGGLVIQSRGGRRNGEGEEWWPLLPTVESEIRLGVMPIGLATCVKGNVHHEMEGRGENYISVNAYERERWGGR